MDHPAHWLKCSFKTSAVATLLMCVLTSHVWCSPHGRALNATITLMQKKIEASLKDLAATGLLSKTSCSSLNETELAGLDEQPLSAHNLSLFRCHLMKAAAFTTELAPKLKTIGQHCENAAETMPGHVRHIDCSLPPFQQDKDSYEFVQCLLELLKQVLSNAQRFI